MKDSASQFMDKQIMDLSNPQNVADGEENSFIDLSKRPSKEMEDFIAAYDHMKIRQALGSTSSAVAANSDADAGDVSTIRRTWNSFDTKNDASLLRSYDPVNAGESSMFSLRKNVNSGVPLNFLVTEIDKILKKSLDSLTNSIDSMTARLSHLETRTLNIENSIDDLKGSVHNNHGSTDEQMRQLENILNEVRTGVGFIKDKQEIMDARLQIAKLQVPPMEKDESNNTALIDPTQGASGNQQFPSYSPAQPPQPLPQLPPPPSLLPFQPPAQESPAQPPQQLPSPPQHQNLQLPFLPASQESYFPPSTQPSEKPVQQYQVSAPQPQPQPQMQYQSPSPLPQYPQQALPSQPQPSQPPPSFSAANTSMVMQHPEEAPYVPPQSYHPSMLPPSSQPPTGLAPPPQQSYGPGPNLNAHLPLPSRMGPGFPGLYGPPGGTGEPYPNPYNNPQSQYGSSSHMKSQQHPSTHPQLPVARILPEAMGSAAPVGSSSSSGNNTPMDDVVDGVTAMGFPRDQVRATVRKLIEDGNAIDLNIVLDKLTNGGEGQARRGWFGR